MSCSFDRRIFADKFINTKKKRCELKWCDISLLYIFTLIITKSLSQDIFIQLKYSYEHTTFLYWYLKILKHFIKFSFSFFFTLKSHFKRIWTSLTLILSSKVVCIWPHWRPTKAIYFVLSKKRNAFNALDRSIYYSTEEKSRLVFTPLLKF